MAGIPFWDLDRDQPGEIQEVDLEEGTLKTTLQDYDLEDFLSSTAIVLEEDEGDIYKLLDGLLEDPEVEDDESRDLEQTATYTYDRNR